MTGIAKVVLAVGQLLLAYSVKKLRNPNKLENAKALNRLIFERPEGSSISDDVPPQLIVVRESVRLCLLFSHNRICVQNHRRAEN